MTDGIGSNRSGPQAALVAFAIRFRGIVLALSCALLGYGLFALGEAKYGVFPEFAPPQVTIQTEAPGLSPEQVEILVTQPIETSINGLAGVESLRSSSIQGLSVVTVVFQPGNDIYRARQLVTERLAVVASRLPQGVQPPSMTPLTPLAGTVLVIGLTSDKLSLMDLRTIADWTVARRLLAVPGVAQVSTYGKDVRSLQVQVRPDDLIRFRVGVNDVLAAARKATGVRGAGFIDTANQRITLQTQGQSLTPDQLARTVLLHEGGASVVLGDVATVVTAPEPPIGAALIDGMPGIMLMVSQQYGANTREVTTRVEAALQELRPGLEADGVQLHADIFRPANFIDKATENVLNALLIGGALVVVVLFLFLFDWRTSIISCTAIPLSLIAAVLALQWMGETLNTMTLGGLAIAIGEVVDDAVIGVENVVRRLRENRRALAPRPEARVVLGAFLEVRTAVAYATFAVLLVFFPILALSGIAGRLFGPLGIAYIFAVLASLAVALTVTPALSMLLLVGRTGAQRLQEPPAVRWSRRHYQALLRRIGRFPKLVMTAAAVLTIAGAAMLPFFGGTFLPDLREGHLILHVSAIPGTSLDESLRIGKLMTDTLRQIPGVYRVAQHAGRAEAGIDTVGPHSSEFEVDLEPGLSGEAQSAAEARIRAALADFPGVSFSSKTYLTERVEETVSGFTAAVVINIYGPDLDSLERAARDVARELDEVAGAIDVQQRSPPGMPQVNVTLRPTDLQRWGLDAVEVLELIRTAYQGDVVGQGYEGNAVFNVIVILDAHARARLTQIGDLPVRTPGGAYILLKQIADVYETSGRYQIQHQNAQRVQTVTANVSGRDLESFVAAAKRKLAREVALPPGAHLEFAGAAEAQARSRRDLIVNSLLAGTGIVILLSMVTGHWRNLLLVMINLPFAFVGGVFALALTGGLLSLGSMVGFVTLFGITLRNSILMISHYEHLVLADGRVWGLDTAIEGAADRLVPILMTSLVTGLGLLPLALGAGEPGREIEGPMAIVILGGLMTSMALSLLVLPTLALRYARFKTRSEWPQGA
ncbi:MULTISPECIES: efflux RND transporter permease subunit [unclassified Bradyrhizobium]|uniref:efflux RND transporter permease subunit n=1 Tax=unclassified Bradyrhizobium TaxID=2631580 RepID=UPI00247B26FF|nr:MULTISPECIES: efflux RND transporter permease subunit [unclassified Bradyrhizobium]WGR73602.1 efflux RND transporter permease subunit [Bradyrhizobium sp. ISRA426]WGR78439.1 efflux RND transporter permease subunit [Bradyrhizobium sp. ISRA430]WGR88841.1 efflux RND transporter permease subunit [Bradyrhizobium sp. ISRA432]